jgi:transcriptional regulator with XRE-family HTH domain
VVTESPTVARRQLRQAIRGARDAQALTQGQVAEALEWSLSKVNRIESGDVTISNTDLRALLTHLGVKDDSQVNELVALGRVARRREDPHPFITTAMHQLFEYERDAVVMRVFQPTLVSGILQTPSYAAAVLRMWSTDFPDPELAARLDSRLRRRHDVLDRSEPPEYLLILDESVLHRVVADKTVTAEQLQSLAHDARRRHVTVRILPFADGLVLSMVGAFTILDLPDETDAILYTEGFHSDKLVDDPDEVRKHRRHFERAWDRTMSQQDSIEFIESSVESLLEAGR